MALFITLYVCLQETPKQEEPIPEAVPRPDRWAIQFPEYPLNEPGELYDPYHQNVLKADYPLFGQNTFFSFTAKSITLVEARAVPTPSGVSTARFRRPDFFGDGDQYLVSQLAVLTIELFEGETSFRPRDWEIRITGALNHNYTDTEENGVIGPDVRRRTDRSDDVVTLQECLVEVHLADLSDDFDFMSLRVGIQPFVSDFRGFIFSDTNLAARLFGTAMSNRLQWNAVAFHQLEKDTNSDLNTLDLRRQQVYIANLFFQDFITEGYTIQGSVHYSRDYPESHFDTNDFRVRPDVAGSAALHDVDVVYLGITGDGHLDRVNINHAFYYANGHDSLNPLAGRAVDIEAQLAALEVSYDFDWIRVRGSALWASGDRMPTNDKATAFDAIFENPNFAGGPFSYWNRQSIKLAGVNLTNRFGQLPNLRSSKTQGQINFVNPGLFLFNVGVDIEVAPELRITGNVNHYRFHHTEPLELLVFQPSISNEVGAEINMGLQWRPFLNNNMIVSVGAAGFFPGRGFTDIYESHDPLYSAFVEVSLTY